MNTFAECRNKSECKSKFKELSNTMHPSMGGDPQAWLDLKLEFDKRLWLIEEINGYAKPATRDDYTYEEIQAQWNKDQSRISARPQEILLTNAVEWLSRIHYSLESRQRNDSWTWVVALGFGGIGYLLAKVF